MERKICNHTVFPSLRTKLAANKITVCPTCLIHFHIFEIAETQAGLERRGGIFASRAAADQGSIGRPHESVRHRALTRRWRVAKIDLYNDLCFLEALRVEGAGKTRWELQLAKAFELWHEVEIECCRMPGYNYAEVEDNAAVDEEELNVDQSVDVEYSMDEDTVSTDTVDEMTDENHGGWQIVKSKRRTAQQPRIDRSLSGTISTNSEGDTTMDDDTRHGSNANAHDPDEVLPQETESVTSTIERDFYWDGRNRYDLLREIDAEKESDTPTSPDTDISPQASTRLSDPTTATTGPSNTPPRSSLKRKCSCTSSHEPLTPKTVRMTDLVTIICDTHARHTTSLPPSQNSYKRTHSSYTTAETARKRLNFSRRSSAYNPHTWALPEEYENVNTSHCNTPWNVYEAALHPAEVDGAEDQVEMTVRLEEGVVESETFR